MILVYSYYVLDILHRGHIEMIRNAKAAAGKDGLLIVGILTDDATREKKPSPILSFEERISVARSIRYVDMVVAQDTYSPLKNVLDIKPDILMESTSHEEDIEVTEAMKSIKGRIIKVPYFPDHSSTNIKEQINESQNVNTVVHGVDTCRLCGDRI